MAIIVYIVSNKYYIIFSYEQYTLILNVLNIK